MTVSSVKLQREQAWSLYVRGLEPEQIAVTLKRRPSEVRKWIADHGDSPEALADARHLDSLKAQLRALHAQEFGANPRRKTQIIGAIGRVERHIYELERRRAKDETDPRPVVRLDDPALAGLVPFTVEHFQAWARGLVLDNGERWEPEQFQLDFVADLFMGRKENWFILPEGNGKTTLVAGLVLYHAEFTPAAYAPVAASSRDQAEILYQQAAGFIARTERLDAIFEYLDGYRRIRCKRNRSRIQIFAADAKTGDGVIPTLAVIEELHRHKDLGLYRTWTGKMRKRVGAQVITISTAGEPYSDFEDTREKIRQLPGATHHGTFTRAASDQIVIHDWAVPPKHDVTDMAVVKSANPFSGVTLESLREDYDSPTMQLAHWSRFKCNIPTRSVRSAINDIEWENARVKPGLFIADGDDKIAIPLEIPAGTHVWVGADAGWKWDTFAFVPMWARDRRFRLFGAATIIEPPRDGTSLKASEVHKALLELHERTPIHTVVMDITRAEETAEWIQDELGARVIEWAQSNENEVLEYERLTTGLRTGWLWHTGDRGLTRHVFNAVARSLPNGKMKFDRAKSTRQGGDQQPRVIDALKAAAMVNAKVYEDFGEEQEPMVGWA